MPVLTQGTLTPKLVARLLVAQMETMLTVGPRPNVNKGPKKGGSWGYQFRFRSRTPFSENATLRERYSVTDVELCNPNVLTYRFDRQ